MRFGFQLMLRGSGLAPGDITRMVRTGEAAGFDIVAPNDHLVVPGGIASTYPYSEDGAWAGAAIGECHEQLTALAFIAGLTERIRILTSVMVVPYRSPVLTAKVVATADVLSGGRVILGCGAGWMEEEFVAVGAAPFAERGRVTDEYLEIFRELWTGGRCSYSGRYARFSDVLFEPKPVQKPHPPIWIGGESPAALRRAARHGNGWYPAANNPRFRIATPDDLARGLGDLGAACEAVGRDPGELETGFFHTAMVGGPRAGPLTGRPDDIAGDIEAFRSAGLDTLVVRMQRDELSPTLEAIDWFGREVISLVR
ncbi:MAG: TIGR03619 family F420-dependent LLM class oxidoreductase [Alphaproteobacteria bacterium]|nr:TIGR03619 family F420-dependent LLM class oxidoreductase [Alphaproteobacteria bacterium]